MATHSVQLIELNPFLADFLLLLSTHIVVDSLAVLLDLLLALDLLSVPTPSVDHVLTDSPHVLNTDLQLKQSFHF